MIQRDDESIENLPTRIPRFRVRDCRFARASFVAWAETDGRATRSINRVEIAEPRPT